MITLFLAAACLNSNDTPPENGTINGNINQPNGNQDVEELYIGTESQRNSRIDLIAPSSDEQFYYYGDLNNKAQLGKISAGGIIDWSFPSSAIIRDLKSPAFSDNLLFAVGANDADQNGVSDEGVFMIIDQKGALLNEITYSIPNRQLWFNSISIWEEDSRYQILVAGGTSDGMTSIPFIKQLTLTPSDIGSPLNADIFDDYTTFDDLDNAFFLNTYREETGIYASLNYLTNGTPVQFELVRIKMDLSGFEWKRSISSAADLNSDTRLGQTLATDEDFVYILGNTDYVKENSQWRAGLIAAIDKEIGTISWKKEINLSERAEDAAALLLDADHIYLAGTYSTYCQESQNLGYGFMARLNKTTGEREAFRSFGGDSFLSSFSALHQKDNQLIGFGLTNLLYADSYDNWILRFNKSDL